MTFSLPVRPGGALLLAAGLLLALSPARGQPAAATEGGPIALPQIDVQESRPTGTSPVRGYVAPVTASATKTDTPLLETPQSITAITRDRLDTQAVRSVEEALRYVPGVTIGSSGFDPRFDGARIRGFDARASQYLDGLRLLRQFGPTSIEPYGLERIEVVRGPASVLYGQTVPGGLINMVSKRPTDTPFGEVVFSAGSHGRVQGAFDLGGPASQDGSVLYRMTGLVRGSGTQIDYVDDNRYFLAPAVTWRPTGDTSLTLLGHFQYDQAPSPIGLPAVGTLQPSRNGTIPRSRYAGEPGFRDSDVSVYGLGWDFRHEFNDTFSLRQNGRWLNNRVDYQTMYGTALTADQATLSRGALLQREGSDTVNIDTTGTARLATGPVSHTILAGMDYRQYWGNYQSYFGRAPSLNLYNPDYGAFVADPRGAFTSRTNRDDRLLQLGLYAQDQLRFRNWLLTIGGRQDWAQSTQTSNVVASRNSSNDNAFTGRVALMYLFDLGLAPYASYSTSFDPVVGAAAPQRGSTSFRPTEGEQWEIGFKYQPPGSNSMISAAYFDLTQTNVATRDPVYTTFQVQTGEIAVHGLELEALASLGSGLNLIGSYTWLDGKIAKANDATVGNRPALVPEHMANLWLDYRIQEGRFQGLGFGAGTRFMSALYGDNANLYRSPSVWLADASISYVIGGWRATVNASNLFDKSYVASCQGGFYCYYGTGRTVIGSLAYRW
ncbi:TonB-dependent siderophore receptor [Roseicella frigidaeris]|uniref:TonB-dependent siderophore receptor n=1 Tax=Roseicella frigidaeris TaxID=2230885 RepID=A0A327M2T5_9PROT|nr:TonB-dependent siderophore receptor [Roseicella frigidaeris]RAI57601.1 TonB-dependent siderophore receptor [Roseicella frigidaeris]